jgi:hypothetical protein
MSIRDKVLGAGVSLGVTIIGGIAIYYITREPHQEPDRAEVRYEISRPVTFSSDTTKKTFQTVRLSNRGAQAATDVVVSVTFSEELAVVDKAITMSTGKAGLFGTPSEEGYEISYFPSLAPEETATISYLVDGIVQKSPEVNAKSAQGIALPLRENEDKPVAESRSAIRTVSAIIVPFALVVQLGLVFYMRRKAKLSQTVRNAQDGSVNDAAFCLLHIGLSAEAKAMLENTVQRHGAGCLVLSNLGLSYAMEGEHQRANELIRAAEFYAKRAGAQETHASAVVLYNRALVAFLGGNEAEGLSSLKSAIAISKTEVIEYCKYSTIVASLSAKYPALEALVAENS